MKVGKVILSPPLKINCEILAENLPNCYYNSLSKSIRSHQDYLELFSFKGNDGEFSEFDCEIDLEQLSLLLNRRNNLEVLKLKHSLHKNGLQLLQPKNDIIDNNVCFNFSEFCLSLEKFAADHPNAQKQKILRFLTEFKNFYSKYEGDNNFSNLLKESFVNNHLNVRTMSDNQNSNLYSEEPPHNSSGETVNLAYINASAKMDLNKRKDNKYYSYSTSMIGVNYTNMYLHNDKIAFLTPSLTPSLNHMLNIGIMDDPFLSDELKTYLTQNLNIFYEWNRSDLGTKLITIQKNDGTTDKEVMSASRARNKKILPIDQIGKALKDKDLLWDITLSKQDEDYQYNNYNEFLLRHGKIIFNHAVFSINQPDSTFTALSIARNLDKFRMVCFDYDLMNFKFPVAEFIQKPDKSLEIHPVSWEDLGKLEEIYECKKDLLENINANISIKWFLENPDFNENQLKEKLNSDSISKYNNQNNFLKKYKPVPAKRQLPLFANKLSEHKKNKTRLATVTEEQEDLQVKMEQWRKSGKSIIKHTI